MDPFPEDWELVGLFESEPALGTEGAPWSHNDLTFTFERPNGVLRCSLTPREEVVRLEWIRDGAAMIELDLRWVRALRVVSGGGAESLVASFRDPHLLDLVVRTAPLLSVSWGTSKDVPGPR